MRIIYLLICCTLLLSFAPNIKSACAVPKTVIAKSEYLMAEKLFNQGDHSGAIKHALKAKKLLGKSNSRIEYLLTKAYNAQGKYGKALAALEEFFAVTPESSSGSDEYNEMVSLYTEVEILWQRQKTQLDAEQREQEKREKALQEVLPELSKQMVAVPGGCFKMGRTSPFGGDDDERPKHKVCLNPFSIGKYEVTQALWSAVMGSNPSHYQKGTNYPVEKVSWEDIQQFIHKLNNETGKNYRLPTEAEWEYAARSGGKNEKYSGSKKPDLVGWYVKNSDNMTHPVGQKVANGLGLYDMSGNVWEWCLDWYGNKYYHDSPENNPIGPLSGKKRVIRGGSFNKEAESMLTVNRGAQGHNSRVNTLGFRLIHP